MKVQFLYHEKNQDLFAFFPEDNMSYSHIGQHSECSKEYAGESRETSFEEHRELLTELVVNVGYTDLEII